MVQIGAVFYVFWGLLHLYAAFQVYKLGTRQAAGMVQGRLYQAAWNLAFFAVAVTVVAVVYNWNNSLAGYWLNLVMASVTDIGFISGPGTTASCSSDSSRPKSDRSRHSDAACGDSR